MRIENREGHKLTNTLVIIVSTMGTVLLWNASDIANALFPTAIVLLCVLFLFVFHRWMVRDIPQEHRSGSFMTGRNSLIWLGSCGVMAGTLTYFASMLLYSS